jgi:hypothetical protein
LLVGFKLKVRRKVDAGIAKPQLASNASPMGFDRIE